MKYLLILLTFICIFVSLKSAQEEQITIQTTPPQSYYLSRIIQPKQIDSFNAMDNVKKTEFLDILQKEIASNYSRRYENEAKSKKNIILINIPTLKIYLEYKDEIDEELSDLIEDLKNLEGAPNSTLQEIQNRCSKACAIQ